MAISKIQMERMQMRMKRPFKHDTHCKQHLAGVYSEPCQASEMEFFATTVNDLEPLKTVTAKRSTLGV